MSFGVLGVEPNFTSVELADQIDHAMLSEKNQSC